MTKVRQYPPKARKTRYSGNLRRIRAKTGQNALKLAEMIKNRGFSPEIEARKLALLSVN